MEGNTHDRRAGGCACGQLRYRLNGAPLIVHGCHCRWCQRETGGALAINALIESDRVELEQGTVERIDTPSESGEGQQIIRCPSCKVAVWSIYSLPVGDAVLFVRVGTLDLPDSLPPDIHIFTSSKQPWVGLPPDVPAVPEYYRWRDYWPEESLRRYQTLRDQADSAP